MKFKAILIFQIFFTTNLAFACLNESRVLLSGEIIVSDDEMSIPYGKDFIKNRVQYEQELQELKTKWKKDKKLDDYSDYGVILVYLGKYKEALSVFKEIEDTKPGLYYTAANLGTTYELLGNNKLAYDWIKRAININPASHDSSEWLHLKILKVKIDGNKYLNSQFLIGTEFGKSKIPKSSLSEVQLLALKSAIYYQLNERVSFIKPKDKIVALLLFELGNICAITDDATSAYEIYKMAAQYGYSSKVFKKRFKIVKNLQLKLNAETKKENITTKVNFIQKSKTENNSYTLYFIGAGVLVVGIFMFLFLRKYKSKK